MSSWCQPLDTPSGRVSIPHVLAVDATWERDSVQTHFEGRRYPVTARSDRVTEEWTVRTVWASRNRADAETYLTLLRDAAVAADSRLEVHFEPSNGAWIDAVVQATDVPQAFAVGSTDVTVKFRKVADGVVGGHGGEPVPADQPVWTLDAGSLGVDTYLA